jgi:hypothetical protein
MRGSPRRSVAGGASKAAVADDESVRLARCLEDIRSFLCHPIMLQVAPANPQHERVYSPRVSVPRGHLSGEHEGC